MSAEFRSVTGRAYQFALIAQITVPASGRMSLVFHDYCRAVGQQFRRPTH